MRERERERLCACTCGVCVCTHTQVCFDCVLVPCYVMAYVLQFGETPHKKVHLYYYHRVQPPSCHFNQKHGLHSAGESQTPSTGLQHHSTNHCHNWLCHRSVKTVKLKVTTLFTASSGLLLIGTAGFGLTGCRVKTRVNKTNLLDYVHCSITSTKHLQVCVTRKCVMCNTAHMYHF